MALHSCGCGGGGGGRDPRGGGGGGERVGSQRAPCPCARLVSGRGPAGWSRSTCAPCLDPRAQPGRNRKSSVLVSQHERLKLKPSQRCEMEQEQWLNVELFKTWRMCDHESPQISDPDGSLHSSWDLGSIVSSEPD
ncbi:uncharacterized protein LOC100041151 isoform X6 [Mus musculus]|uniref:uncharacterized protein LOC100041151 isoform X6 n=1 Tax=Mus musculus TaxID=10090 RepID=UPI0016719E96|nr:uncharacterized protein LOC100041151 isoform X6 [Mus musculus]